MTQADYEKQLKEEFNEEFGTLSARQLWVLTKFAKRVRLRGRNNSAFNNMANRLFPYANFKQVTKRKLNGELYPGLEIIASGEVASEEEGEE
jgi:Tfp pilus assembly protein PilF